MSKGSATTEMEMTKLAGEAKEGTDNKEAKENVDRDVKRRR